MKRVSLLVAFTTLTSFSITLFAAAEDWRPLGPAPIRGEGGEDPDGEDHSAVGDHEEEEGGNTGRVSAIACSRRVAGKCWVGGADGGLWRTDDKGKTWTFLTADLATTSVGAIVLQPDDEDTIYVGTGEANFANHSRYGLGIYKTQDGGKTWVLLGAETFAGRCISRLAIDPRSPNTIYAAVTPAGGFPEKVAAKNHPGANGALGVFKSEDAGNSWSHLAGGLPAEAATDLALDEAHPGTLVAAIGRIFGDQANGLYRTDNYGKTWQKLAGGLPKSDIGRLSVAISKTDTKRVYALIARPATDSGDKASTLGAWRSDDGGDNWKKVFSENIQSTYGWYLNVVGIDPQNADNVILGGFSLQRSTDGGRTWTNVTATHVDNHALAWDKQGMLWVGNDGGVQVSTNLGQEWEARNEGLSIVQFYAGLSLHPSEPNVIYGGVQDNGTVRRDEEGKDWDALLGGDGGWTGVDPSAPNRVFAEYQGAGSLFLAGDGRSMDYAATGIEGSDRTAFQAPFAFDPENSKHMFYATHRLYESTNGGTIWAVKSDDLTLGKGAVRSLAVSPVNSLRIWAATNDGLVVTSKDGGKTFVRALEHNPGWPRITREVTPDPLNENTAYLAVSAFNGPRILKTQDAGASWESIGGNLPDVPVNVVLATKKGSARELFAGTDQGVWKSLDEGKTWQKFGAGLPNAPVVDLRRSVDEGHLVAGTMGRGAWEVSLR